MNKQAVAQCVICTDVTCDLTLHEIAELGNPIVIPMVVTMPDGKEFKHYPDWRERSYPDFYGQLKKEGLVPKTAAINPSDFENAWWPTLKAGKDILYIGFSSGLSATLNSAMIARNNLREEYPDRAIYIVDSLTTSAGLARLVKVAANALAEGTRVQEVVDWIERMKFNTETWFVLFDLKNALAGGRLSKTQATFGSLLDVKPILKLDNTGKLTIDRKVRGSKRAISELTDSVAKRYDGGEITVIHAGADEEAELVVSTLLQKLPGVNVRRRQISAVVGAHAFPVVGIEFVGKEGR